jgi:class 3 adenylate cyclase/tetratricopeptide (TPR) repeat protein
LAAVQLGGELVTAPLPALEHLVDGVAGGLVAVQLSGPGADPPPRRRRRLPRPPPWPQALDLLVEVAAEAAQVEQRLRQHAAGRRQLARSRRTVVGQHLHQRPGGGQLLAAQRLLEVPRAPPALRPHAITPHRSDAPWSTPAHSVASRRRFEYPVVTGAPTRDLSERGLPAREIIPILDGMPACPTCDAVITEPRASCPRCGAPLAASDSSGEFRIVTVLFCDVVNSTALGRQLEPVVTKRVNALYGEAVRRVLGGGGARVGKRHGDGFMAAFGILELHEDDALRAVHAAGELRAAIGELSEELRRERGVDFEIRIGINTGNLLVNDAGTMEEDLTGDAVNLAKRFEEAAGVGEIILGEETYRLVADAVVAEPAGRLTIDGFPGPQDTWRLLEILPDRPGRVRRFHAPMVGRELEGELLGRLLERVVAEESCHLASVLGPGGVGKSRLVDEFVGRLGARAAVLRAHCPQLGTSVTMWPLVEIVRQAAEISSADSPELARTRVAELVRDEERGELVAERVAQMLGVVAGAERPEGTLWAVHRLLRAGARRRPLVVVIDDLQWADPILLDAVEQLIDLSQDTPMLLVCIARPDELLSRHKGWPATRVNALSLRLSPLGEREGEQLVGHLLGGRVDPAVHALVTERAQGYPLIVEELVANLRDEGRLRDLDGRWVLRLEATDADGRDRWSIPTSIHALLQARLERLEAREAGGRAIIEASSVVGEQFHVGDVQALTRLDDPAAVDAVLQELVRLDLLQADHSAASVPLPPGSGPGYRFRHPMIQSVAYERMPEDRRAELHERYADWLAERTRDNPDQFDELVAHHFHESYRYASKLNPGDDHTRQVACRAGERYSVAGRRAVIRGDSRLVQAWLGRAVRLLPDDHPDRLRALPQLAEAQQASGKLTEAARAYQELAKSATAGGHEGLATHATIGRLRLLALHDPERFLREGRDQVELAIPVFERLDDPLGLAKAWHLLAYLDWTRGRLSVAGASSEKARSFARAARDRYWEATILGQHCLILYWGSTPLDQVERANREALAEARRSGMRALEATTLRVLARVAALRGSLDEARQLVGAADAITADLGESLTQAADCISRALIELLDDDLAAAEEMLRSGYVRLEEMGATGPLASVAAMMARVVLLRGRGDEAEELTRTCERIAAPSQLDAQVKWRSIRAIALARRGDPDADRLARRAVDLADASDQIDSRAEARVDLAEVLRLGGRRGEAGGELDRAILLYREKGNEIAEASARRLLARVRQ